MFNRKSLAAIGFACFGVLSAVARGQAAEPAAEKVKVIAFPGGNLWPVFVAQEKKFFARNGIDVDVTFTPGSQFQMMGLIEGKFDIAVTGMDNAVAYDEGQGAVSSPNKPDVAAFMGLANGFLHLIAAPDVKSYQDLKGKRLGVDAVTTGYAFVLRKMLETRGVGWDDVKVVEAGGVKNRFDALMKKQLDATLVVSPLEIVAKKAGYVDLGDATVMVGPYQGDVAVARRAWMREHPAAVVGFVKAMQQSIDWLYDPANHDEAIDILGKAVPPLRGPAAEASYRIMVNRQTGFFPDLAISEKGLATVLRLRSEYSPARRPLTDPSKYIDLSYYQMAKR